MFWVLALLEKRADETTLFGCAKCAPPAIPQVSLFGQMNGGQRFSSRRFSIATSLASTSSR